MTSSSCNACDGPLKTRFDAVLDPETRETFGIAECEACGLGHTTPQPADLNCYYGQNYHGGRHSLTAAYCAKRRLRLVTRAAGSGRARRLLDVGCGDGTFLLAARDAGWKVVGTEIAAGIARAAGLDVVDSLEQAQEKGPFDCITLWHSLEHMRDPRAILKDLAQQLTPDGSLVIAVPNAEGLQARVFGPFWFHLDVPRHLYHFGDRSITQLLNNVGLTVQGRWHQEFEYDMLGWSQSALNKVLPVPNVFFNRLTRRPLATGKNYRLASDLMGVIFTTLALPATALGTVLRRGGTIITVARP